MTCLCEGHEIAEPMARDRPGPRATDAILWAVTG
ncbi:hypothetical protein SAMN05216276_103292 [Streptosporangium subroseum]|uniref:Uncharacterized protein n=1 Tax=Streptosporangium subroseum TaxID=106412 RepID=A0A239LEH3_9ACTN|nr:hypothetical protein SAMN05216276_103292 [Streptosporangium subroseum]